MHPKPTDFSAFLDDLSVLARRLSKQVDTALRDADLEVTHADAQVLLFVRDNAASAKIGGLRLTDIAKGMALTVPGARKSLVTLEKRGWIRSDERPWHQNQDFFTITTAGTQLLFDVLEVREAVCAGFLNMLDGPSAWIFMDHRLRPVSILALSDWKPSAIDFDE